MVPRARYHSAQQQVGAQHGRAPGANLRAQPAARYVCHLVALQVATCWRANRDPAADCQGARARRQEPAARPRPASERVRGATETGECVSGVSVCLGRARANLGAYVPRPAQKHNGRALSRLAHASPAPNDKRRQNDDERNGNNMQFASVSRQEETSMTIICNWERARQSANTAHEKWRHFFLFFFDLHVCANCRLCVCVGPGRPCVPPAPHHQKSRATTHTRPTNVIPRPLMSPRAHPIHAGPAVCQFV